MKLPLLLTGCVALLLPGCPAPEKVRSGARVEGSSGRPAPHRPARPRGPLDIHGDPLPRHAVARLGSVRMRHRSVPSAVAASPDGKLLASAAGNRVSLWRATDGRSLWRHRFYPSKACRAMRCRFKLAFSADGRSLAVTGRDCKDSSDANNCGASNIAIEVFDTGPGQRRRTLSRGNNSVVSAMSFTAKGKRLVAVYRNSKVLSWDLSSGKYQPAVVPKDLPHKPDFVTLATAAGMVVSADTDNTITIWRPGKDKPVRKAKGCRKHGFTGGSFLGRRLLKQDLVALAVSPDGNYLVTHCEATYQRRQGMSLGFGGRTSSRMENYVVHRLIVQHTTQKLEIAEPTVCKARPGALSFSPTGEHFAVGCPDGKVHLLQIREGFQDEKPRPRSKGRGLVGVLSGGLKAHHLFGQKPVKLKKVRATRAHPSAITALAFSGDGTRLVSAAKDRSVRLWKTSTGARVRTSTGHHSAVIAAAYTPDGKHIVSAGADHTLRLWYARSGKLLRSLRGHRLAVNTLSLSRDGKLVASGSDDRTVRLWKLPRGKTIRVIGKHETAVRSVALSPYGKLVATTGNRVPGRRVRRAALPVSPLPVSPLLAALTAPSGGSGGSGGYGGFGSGRRVPSGYGKGVGSGGRRSGSGGGGRGGRRGIRRYRWIPEMTLITLWDTATGKEVRTVEGVAPCGQLAFSPDGKLLAARCKRGVRIWTVATGKALHTLKSKRDTLRAPLFTPSGTRLITLGKRHVRTWSLSTGKQLSRFAATANCTRLAISADGKHLALTCGKQVEVRDARSGRLLRTLRGHWKPASTAAFSPREARLVTASPDSTLLVWSTPRKNR